jgi:hypothetical protein
MPRSLPAWALLLLATAGAAGPVRAEFAVLVTPPRFELRAQPGERVRQVLELTSSALRASAVHLRTADWRLRPDDPTVDFFDELQPGSCRPWVAIERREVLLAPGRPHRYRFEITVPPDAPVGECRFALMVEGREPTLAGPGQALPLVGRIGVIVYVAVRGAAPLLQLAGHAVVPQQGRPTPVLRVRNDGTAHGRLDGLLRGTDARGEVFEVGVGNGPVLPGETRAVPLLVARPGLPDEPVTPAWPLRVTGRLELGAHGTALDVLLAP